MKKLYVVLLFVLITFRGFSQSPDTTLQSPNFIPGNVIIYGLQGGGYLTGTGQFSEFYQKYSLKNYASVLGISIDTPAWVDKVYVLYGKKSIGGTPGYIKSRFYKVVYNADANMDVNSNPTPGNGPDTNGPLGGSDSLNLAAIPTPTSTLQQVALIYQTPVKVTEDSFFVSCAISQNPNDTFVIASTKSSGPVAPYNGPVPPFPVSSWMSLLASDGSGGFVTLFYDYNYLLNASGITGGDLDLGIFPHITHNSLGVKDLNSDELFVMPFPNPASSEFYIGYDITKGESVRIRLMDMLGRTVADLGAKNQAPGTHTEVFDVSSFASGTYIYSVETSYGQKTGKVIVRH